MTDAGTVPPYVTANVARRAAAALPRPCTLCGATPALLHACGHRCAGCSPSRNPVPDPLLAEAHMRATYGMGATPNRTSEDDRVERLGQRVGSARRAAARGDESA